MYRAQASSTTCSPTKTSNTKTVTVSGGVTAVTASSPFYEPFSASPSCWNISQVSGTANWSYETSATNPAAILPYNGTHFAQFNSSLVGSNGSVSRLISPVLDISDASMTSPYLSFVWLGGSSLPGKYDKMDVYVSTDAGLTWGSPIITMANVYPNAQKFWNRIGTVDLSAYAGLSSIRVMFEGHSTEGANMALDEVYVLNSSCDLASAVSSSNITSTTADISWTASADSSRVYFRVVGDTLWRKFKSYTTSSSYTIPMLLPGATYEYYVSTWCGVVNKLSAGANFTTGTSTTPPSNLTASAISAAKVTFQWDSIVGATGYLISISSDNGATWSTPTKSTSPLRRYSNLTPNTTYIWRVTSLYGFGYDTPFDTSIGGQFSTAGCSASNMVATVFTSKKATLTWDPVPGATKYRVRLSIDGGITWRDSVDITTNTRTYSLLIPGTAYKWQVSSGCDAVFRSYVTGPDFSTPASRLGDLDVEETIYTIYPNPSSGGFNINLGDQSGSVYVTDMNGTYVYKADGIQMITIGESWTPGIYVVHLTVGGKSYMYKLVKI